MAPTPTDSLVTLKYHLERRLQDQRELLEARLLAIENATKLASETINVRLEGMNEFRNSLKDQTGTLATKDALDMQRDALEAKLEALRKTMLSDMRPLQEFVQRAQGMATEASVSRAFGFAVIGLGVGAVGTIVGVISLFLKLTG